MSPDRVHHAVRASTALVLLLPIAGCLAPEGLEDYVRIEGPGGRLLSVPISRHDAVSRTCWVRPEDWRATGAPCVYNGACGSPVIIGGEVRGVLCVGAAELGYPGTETTAFGYEDIEIMRRIARHEAEASPASAAAGVATAGIQPGSALFALTMWGDVRCGVLGTCTFLDGSMFGMLGHPPAEAGQRNLAIASSHRIGPIATERDGQWRWDLMGEIGQEIGSAAYDSTCGPVGMLGTTTPALQVEFRTRQGGRVSVALARNVGIDLELRQLWLAVASRLMVPRDANPQFSWFDDAASDGGKEMRGDWQAIAQHLTAACRPTAMTRQVVVTIEAGS